MTPKERAEKEILAPALSAHLATHPEDETRQAFEKWVDPDGRFPRSIAKNEKGQYLLQHTSQDWHTWQAATAAARAERV